MRDVDNLEVKQFIFSDFGKNVPKSMGLSPDSFIQVAFQLTYYRLHHKCPPAYETGTLRKFEFGRTDTIRLPNPESVQFVEEMERNFYKSDVDYSHLQNLLSTAVKAHKHYSKDVLNGNRYLFFCY